MALGERGGWIRQARQRAGDITTSGKGGIRRWRAQVGAHSAAIRRIGLRLGVALTVGGVAAGWALYGSPWLRVEQVRVHVADPTSPSSGAVLADGSAGRRSAEIVRIAELPVGQPLVEVDTSEATRRIEELNRYSTVTVERSWPSAVDVTVTPRVAVLAAVAPGDRVELIDGDGTAFESVSRAPAGLPLATLPAQVGDAGRAAASATLALSPQRRAQLQRIAVGADGSVVLELGAVAVAWGPPGQERLKSAVVDALVDRPGLERLDVSAPSNPVAVGGAGVGA